MSAETLAPGSVCPDSPAVVHDSSQQIIDLGRASLEAVVHVDIVLVVVLEGLHDVLKVGVLP